MGLLKKALDEQAFVCLTEFVPKPSAQHFGAFEQLMAHSTLCGWPMIAAVADRVGGNLDLAPLDAVAEFNDSRSALVHFSGKDRERRELLAQLKRMDAVGLDELLMLTGDRLPGHEPGQRPVRYLESVPALQIVRQERPDWLLGAALNPFKYREEEGGAQYFKAEKKLAAGADFLTLQLGFDIEKHREALAWMRRQTAPKPLLACVMGLTKGRAAMLGQVAGVVITPSMREVLEAEETVSKAYAQERSVSRLALQIIGLQWMGYAGIHLSGVHQLKQLQALEQALTDWRGRIHTRQQWDSAWADSWSMPGLPAVAFHAGATNWRLGESHVQASGKEQLRYHLMSGLHSQLFSRTTWLSQAFGWAVKRPLWSSPQGARWLHRVERSLKRPLVGCDTCGRCRLEDTLYICPETCPKGLANGPCGGTHLNRCEFGDRECVHSVKYRTAKAVGQEAVLIDRLIPCIEVESRHQSSWPRWFEEHLPVQAGPGRQAGEGERVSPSVEVID